IRKSRTHLDRPLLFSDAGASDSDFVNSFRYFLECEPAIEIDVGIVDEPAVDRFDLRPLQAEIRAPGGLADKLKQLGLRKHEDQEKAGLDEHSGILINLRNFLELAAREHSLLG